MNRREGGESLRGGRVLLICYIGDIQEAAKPLYLQGFPGGDKNGFLVSQKKPPENRGPQHSSGGEESKNQAARL